MKKFGYIVDSAISMDQKVMDENDIYKVCYSIDDSEGNSYEDDGISLTRKMIEDKLNNGIIFKSGAVSPGKVMLLLEDIINKYEKIILFTISSGLSSFYQNTIYLKEEYKDKLYIVDTSEIGHGITDIVLDSKRMLEKENKSIDEVIEYASNCYKNNFTVFTCNNWESLRKSGRAPSLLAKTFDILKTKPLIRFYIKNKLAGISTSLKKQVNKMLDIFYNTFKNIDNSKIKKVVFYNNNVNEDDAKFIRDTICQRLNITIDDIVECFAPNLVWIYTANQSFGIHIQTSNQN